MIPLQIFPTKYLLLGMAIALALTVAGAGLAIWYLDGKLERANAALLAEERAHGHEIQARAQWQAQAVSCGKATLQREKLALAADGAYQKASAENRELSKAVQAHIQAMLSRPRTTGLNECQAMKEELDAEIDRRRR